MPFPRGLYDNTTLAVARILGDGERQKTRTFSELQSYYLFAEKFGRPAKGNDKGTVENLVGYARRNFMVPIPHTSGWEELNAQLESACRQRRERRVRFTTAAALVSELIEARDEKHLLRFQKQLAATIYLSWTSLASCPCPRPAPSLPASMCAAARTTPGSPL